jgi:hypothetical protein
MPNDPGIFIGVGIDGDSAKLIRRYAESLGIPNLLPMNKYHVSVMYSKISPSVEYPVIDTEFAIPAYAYDLRYIGNAIAIILNSPWLRWRFSLAKACGIKSDYPGFIPHMSLCYDPPLNLPIGWYPKPRNIPIILTNEYVEAAK